MADTTGDEMATISDTGISAMESAVQSLLDASQNDLGFPTAPAPPGGGPVKPASQTLTYYFKAEASIGLREKWTVFEGLTLEEVSLTLGVAKIGGQPGRPPRRSMRVDLSAVAQIGDLALRVTGAIPSLTQDGQIDFLLRLETRSALDSFLPNAVIHTLTRTEDWNSVTANVDQDVTAQVATDTQDGVSFATDALVHVRRDPSGSFFLKELGISFDGDLDWTVISDRLELSNISLGLLLSRDTPTSSWRKMFAFDGLFNYNETITIQAEGTLDLGDKESKLTVDIRASYFSQAAALDVLNKSTGGVVDASKVLTHLPEDVLLESAKPDPFRATLELTKTGAVGQWLVRDASLTIEWGQMFWSPIRGSGLENSLILESLFFRIHAYRSADGTSSETPALEYEGYFGGTLTFFGTPFIALVRLQDNLIILECSSGRPNHAFSLQELASDELLNPPQTTTKAKTRDLSSVLRVPDCVPVDLDWAQEMCYGSDKTCVLTFSQSELVRLQLKASLGQAWKVSPNLTIDDMGMYFDITSPLQADSSYLGYAYGSFTLPSISTTIYAFVGGVSDSTLSRFWVHLSAKYTDPNGGLDQEPQVVFSDSKMMGTAAPTDGWEFPDSMSAIPRVADALTDPTSLKAEMNLLVSQKDISAPESEWVDSETKLEAIAAELSVTGTWEIFSGVTLESLSLRVLGIPTWDKSGTRLGSYEAAITGRLAASMLGSSGYTVEISGQFQHREASPGDTLQTFVASVEMYKDTRGNTATLREFLGLPLFGSSGLDPSQDQSASAIPNSMKKPADLLAGPAASCSLVVSREKEKAWVLESIRATISSGPWEIIKDTITVVDSSLVLVVTKPRDDELRRIQFMANVTVRIGTSVTLTGSVVVVKGPTGTVLTLALTAQSGSIQDCLTTLTGTSTTMPPQCPVGLDDGKLNFALELICSAPASNPTNFSVDKITATLAILGGRDWNLGPVRIALLSFAATIVMPRDGKPTTTAVTFFGSMALSGQDRSVNVILTYLTPILSLSISSSTSFNDVVPTFVPGGMSALQPPSLPRVSTFDDYASRNTAGMLATFSFIGGTWTAESLELFLENSEAEWVFSRNILTANKFKFSFVVTKPTSSSRAAKVVLSVTFNYFAPKSRLPPGKTLAPLPCNLIATRSHLKAVMDTSSCTIPSFVYIATGGILLLPDFMDWPVITPQTLSLYFDWDRGTGGFQAVCGDWNLIDVLPHIGNIRRVTLEASLSRMGGRVQPAGKISGIVTVLLVPVSIAYDLVTGEFTIYGINPKKVIELAKKLYETVKNILEVAKIIADIAEFAEIASAAAEVFGFFVSVGVALGAAGNAVMMAFDVSTHASGGKGWAGASATTGNARAVPSQDDPSSNWDDTDTGADKSAGYLVVGGSLLSAGPGGEDVDLVVYPKTKLGTSLRVDPVGLVLKLYVGDNRTAGADITPTWTPMLDGFRASLKRPSDLVIGTTLEVSCRLSEETTLKREFPNRAQPEKSRFDLVKSKLVIPKEMEYGKEHILELYPRDQLGQPILGAHLFERVDVSVQETPTSGKGPLYDSERGFRQRNDCLLLPFTLPAPGEYGFRFTSSTSGMSRTEMFKGIKTAHAKHSTAYGPGLCSGPAKEATSFSIQLRDQGGLPFFPPRQAANDGDGNMPDSLNLSVILHDPATQGQDVKLGKPLHWTSDGSDSISVKYTRPETLGTYHILITINGVSLSGADPIEIDTTAQTVAASVSTSVLKVWTQSHKDAVAPVFAVGDTVTARVSVYDGATPSRRFRNASNISASEIPVIQWPEGFSVTDATTETSVDGVVTFRSTIGSSLLNAKDIKIVVTGKDSSAGQQVAGSPFSINEIKPARHAAKIRVYGTGLTQMGHRDSVQIRVSATDQYGASWSVDVHRDMAIQVFSDSGELIASSDTDDAAADPGSAPVFTYTSPGTGGHSVILIERKGDSQFPAQLHRVPLEPAVTAWPDAGESFMVWDEIVKEGLSTATLYVCDGDGDRYRKGGDYIRVLSGIEKASILTASITDNLDGSYTLKMLMPAEAFVKPGLGLNVLLNNEHVKGSPFSFPLAPLPIVKAHIASLSTVGVVPQGKLQTVTVACMDQDNKPILEGTPSIEGYLIPVGRKEDGSMDGGLIPCSSVGWMPGSGYMLSYTIPLSSQPTEVTKHDLFVFVNSRPVDDTSIRIESVGDNLEDIKELDDNVFAHSIVHHSISMITSSSLRLTQTGRWNLKRSTEDGTMEWLFNDRAAPSGEDVVTLAFQPPEESKMTDTWLENGFFFAFDFAVHADSGSTYSASLSPIDNRDLGGSADKGTSLLRMDCDTNVYPTSFSRWHRVNWLNDQDAMDLTKPNPIAFLYLLSPDSKSYTQYIFWRGIRIAHTSWARRVDPATGGTNIPKIGLTFSTRSQLPTVVTISNITTIPSYCKIHPSPMPEPDLSSQNDILLSAPWASSFVTSGTFTKSNGEQITGGVLGPKGLLVDGTPPSNDPSFLGGESLNLTDSFRYQQQPALTATTGWPMYSIQIYYLSIDKWHPRAPKPADPKPAEDLKPYIFFGYFHSVDPSTGRYIWLEKWSSEIKGNSTALAGLYIGTGQMNTVVVVQGYQSQTVFVNGLAAPELRVTVAPVLAPQFRSGWVDVRWHGVRAVPGVPRLEGRD
ncbi:hypothetical protein QBC47DRAFT_415542 [Echria macrotheca]|uniref:Uncharacterized protein n=1 Tax=Echria macrotheca TaxID=438768 RepID=A0AAJ0F4U5_9PEZI|nr:hypothetical protein QBC47DRAFT_415542 [Echria macrotheca]